MELAVQESGEAMKGGISISMQVNTTISEDTMMGTTGRARMELPVTWRRTRRRWNYRKPAGQPIHG